MNKINVYTLERRGYFKERGEFVDIFLELHPTPDFAPSIKQDVNYQMYLAKRDKIVGDKIAGTNGRFKKKDRNVLEYREIERMEVGDTMEVIRIFTTEDSKK